MEHFSTTTGLVANMEKSSIFIAGMGEQLKEQMINLTGFTQGVLPIRYLGLPLSSKKWSKIECQSLIDKITGRIKTTYSRQLSYAGRMQVILAVLFSIHLNSQLLGISVHPTPKSNERGR